MAGCGEGVRHHADHVGKEYEEEEREDEREEAQAFFTSGRADHVGDEAIADLGHGLRTARHQRLLGSGVAEEGDAEHHAQQHEAGGVGEGNVDIAEAQVQPLRDLELVDRINRGVLQSEVHSFPVPSVGASGSDKFPSARAFSSR